MGGGRRGKRKGGGGVFNSASPTHPSKKKMFKNENGDWVCPNLWNYRNSFFFAATLGCSIGFGDQYPVTDYGRSFSVVYALLMLPLIWVQNHSNIIIPFLVMNTRNILLMIKTYS
jgi:hypothetical protein